MRCIITFSIDPEMASFIEKNWPDKSKTFQALMRIEMEKAKLNQNEVLLVDSSGMDFTKLFQSYKMRTNSQAGIIVNQLLLDFLRMKFSGLPITDLEKTGFRNKLINLCKSQQVRPEIVSNKLSHIFDKEYAKRRSEKL